MLGRELQDKISSLSHGIRLAERLERRGPIWDTITIGLYVSLIENLYDK